MTKDRYEALMRDPSSQLSDDEKGAGWFFCLCEWDGLLTRDGLPEAAYCHCRRSGHSPDNAPLK